MLSVNFCEKKTISVFVIVMVIFYCMFEPSIIYYDTLYPSSNGISVGNNKMTITFPPTDKSLSH